MDPKTLLVTHTWAPPVFKTAGAAGMDLCINDAKHMMQGKVELFDTGVKVAIPDGYFGMVTLRSSMALRGIILLNAPGIIDSDYRGEIKLALMRVGNEYVRLEAGERVAQLVILPYEKLNINEVESLPPTERGEGGFGSTGKV